MSFLDDFMIITENTIINSDPKPDMENLPIEIDSNNNIIKNYDDLSIMHKKYPTTNSFDLSVENIHIYNNTLPDKFIDHLLMFKEINNLTINLNLKRISTKIFQFKKLQRLDLSNNLLEPNELNGIHELKSLEQLYLKNIGGSLSYDIFKLVNLKKLVLDNNSYKFIINSIFNENLKENNKYYQAAQKFLCKYHPQYFEFDNVNDIQCFNLQKLSLKNCFLDKIPEFIFSLTNLEKLDLSSNSIVSVSSKIKNLTKMKYLNISSNNFNKNNVHLVINKIPACLTHLDISNNKINYLDLSKFTNLTFLNLSNTYIIYLNIISQLTNLTDLNINNITYKKLTKLEIKYQNKKNINHSQEITNIQNILKPLINLKTLSCDNIKLSTFPNVSINLEKISLVNCAICEINNDNFANLTKLSHLDICKNDIKELPEILFTMSSLIDLKYSTDKIEKLPNNFWNRKDKTIDFKNNKFLKNFPPNNIDSDATLHMNLTIEQIPEKIKYLHVYLNKNIPTTILNNIPHDVEILYIHGKYYYDKFDIVLPPLIKSVHVDKYSIHKILNEQKKPLNCEIHYF